MPHTIMSECKRKLETKLLQGPRWVRDFQMVCKGTSKLEWKCYPASSASSTLELCYIYQRHPLFVSTQDSVQLSTNSSATLHTAMSSNAVIKSPTGGKVTATQLAFLEIIFSHMKSKPDVRSVHSKHCMGTDVSRLIGTLSLQKPITAAVL